MKTFRLFFFWSHFCLYIVQQLNLPDFLVALTKGLIGGLYIVCLMLLLAGYNMKLKVREIFFLTVLAFVVLAKVIFLTNINVALIYWTLCFFCVGKLEWSYREILKVVNQAAIVYFVIALLLVFSPLKVLFSYELRELENRFFPSISRFIGVEGSPAGPDLFYTIVLILNVYSYRVSRLVRMAPFWIAVLVILWTASLSNLVSLVLASLIYLFYRFRYISLLLTLNFFLFSNFLIEKYGMEAEFFLNAVTTLRANIWNQVGENLKQENQSVEWILGRTELMEFMSVGGEESVLDANPHNLSLFAYQFLGIPLYILFVFMLTIYISRVPKGLPFFILVFLVSYSITNAMPFTTRGNPIVIYIFTFFILNPFIYENRIFNSVPSKARDDKSVDREIRE